jgi:hypothetical protein
MASLSPPAPTQSTAVTVRQIMNDHGTMTVEVTETNETRYLVDYASSRIRSTLASLPVGSTVPVELERVGGRSNVWRVDGFGGVPRRG